MAYSVNVYNPLDIRGKTNHNKSYASKKGKKKRKGVVDDNSIRYCASFPSAIAKGDKETLACATAQVFPNVQINITGL